MQKLLSTILMIAFVVVPLALAQGKPAGSGHWEGTIQLPDRELKVAVDLAQNDKGEWIADMDIPEQNAKDVPLSKIVVKDASVSFALEGIPGDPSFTGQLSTDGKTLRGDFTQGGGSFAMVLKWVSEPDVKLPAKSTAIAKEFEGTWEGTLSAPNGQQLRLRLKLASGASGATGVLNSLDQGGQDIPINTITQKDAHIKLEVKLVNGFYEGDLKADELSGTWNQGMPLPLTFKRAKN
jgi:hypothetical protein